MNKTQEDNFVKRFQELEAKQKDLDYHKSVLSRDIRATFATGKTGDDQFLNWFNFKLGVLPGLAREYLLRAEAAAIVPDEKAWLRLGGFKAVKQVIDLPKKEQINTLQAAQAGNVTVRSVMVSRGHIQATAPKTLERYKGDAMPAGSATKDLGELARWMHKNVKTMPDAIRVIVDMYR